MMVPCLRFFKPGILLGFTLTAVITLAIGCGEKTPLPSDLPDPVYGGIDTNYIQITPIWNAADGVAFNRPEDVYVGYDQTIYICDTGNDRVINLEADGTVIAVYPVVHPVAITQDRGLDLLVVCGDYARVEIDDGDTNFVPYGNAVFRRSFRHGGGFVKVWQADSPYHAIEFRDTVLWVDAEFYGISATLLESKSYYVADRYKGRIILFGADDLPKDTYLSEGIGLGFTSFPTDLTSYQIAGQTYISLAQGVGNLAVQLFSLPNFISLYSDNDTLPPMIRFTARSYKDLAVDELSNFYLLLRDLDPLLGANHHFYKFNRRGELLQSFGTAGSGDRQFNNPNGITVFDGIVYIADTGNNRITRYQLATEIRQ
jgi:hypothetical protein